MGLAVYNGTILDIRFPPVVYKKLLSPAVVPYNNPNAEVGRTAATLDDLSSINPVSSLYTPLLIKWFTPVAYKKLLSPAVVPYNNPKTDVGWTAATLDKLSSINPVSSLYTPLPIKWFTPVTYKKLLSPTVLPHNNPDAEVGRTAATLDDWLMSLPTSDHTHIFWLLRLDEEFLFSWSKG